MPHEASNRFQLWHHIRHWRDQPNQFSQLLGGYPDTFNQVRVIGKDRRNIALFARRTEQEMRRQIYIAAFRFRLVNPNNSCPRLRKL